jgi:hypothetical protein
MVQRPACGSQVADPRFSSDARVKQPGHDNEGELTQHPAAHLRPTQLPVSGTDSRPRLADSSPRNVLSQTLTVFHGKGWRGPCEAAFSRLCPCRQGSDVDSVDQSGTSRDEGGWSLVRSAKMRRWPQSLHCQRRLVRQKDRLCTGQNECLWLQPHLRSSSAVHRRPSLSSERAKSSCRK